MKHVSRDLGKLLLTLSDCLCLGHENEGPLVINRVGVVFKENSRFGTLIFFSVTKTTGEEWKTLSSNLSRLSRGTRTKSVS